MEQIEITPNKLLAHANSYLSRFSGEQKMSLHDFCKYSNISTSYFRSLIVDGRYEMLIENMDKAFEASNEDRTLRISLTEKCINK